MPPLFFTKFSEILRKNQIKSANYRQITSKLKYNYLIFNKIKILFFLLKSVAIIKKWYICNVKQQQKKTTMEEFESRMEVLNDLREIAEQVRKLLNENFSDICPGKGDRVADELHSEIIETERTLIYWSQKNAMEGGEE